MSDRFKKIVHDQIKVRDSGSVRCEDVLQTILTNREKYGTVNNILLPEIVQRFSHKSITELNETEIAGNCFIIFIEANDTTPNALVLALYQLAKNKHIQDKLAQSIESSIAANNNEVTYDLIQKHEYLEKVLYGKMLSSQT